MTSKNHHNLQCDFSEDLVSYLYGEIDSSEKNAFEKHLDKCASCDEELAAFGYIRASVRDWRVESFDLLETPKVKISFNNEHQTAETLISSNPSKSWIESIREIFSISPVWATSAIAILVLVLFSAVFMLNSSGSNELSATQPENKIEEKEIVLPKSETASTDNFNQNKVIKIEENSQHKTSDKSVASEKNPVENRNDNSSSRKLVVRSEVKLPKNNKTKKPVESAIAGNDRNKNNIKNSDNLNLRDAPKLSNLVEEDDDDALSLADLFDEVGSR